METYIKKNSRKTVRIKRVLGLGLICLSVLLLFSTVFIMACQPKTVPGKTYYISSSAGDDSADGLTTLTPLKSFENLEGHVFSPGDKILFKRGDQFGRLYLKDMGNGTADNPIILGAYGEANLPNPILDAKGTQAKTLYITNMSHWTVQDLKIQGSTSHQFLINPQNAFCDGIKILRCHINGDKGKNAIRFETNPKGPEYYGCRNIEIAYCYIENAGQGLDDISDGINAPNIQLNAYIHHNEFYNNVSEAIDLSAGKNHRVEYNKINGNGYIHSGGIKTHALTGNQIHDTENITIGYNIIYNCIQHGIAIQDARNVKVFNNTVYHNHKDSKVALLLGTANEAQYKSENWVSGNKITNNIFVGNTHNPKQTVIRFTGDRMGSPSTIWNDTANFKIQNNIIYGGEDKPALLVRIRKKSFIDFFNVPVEGAQTIEDFFKLHNNNIAVNPDFQDPDKGDFSLSPNSPAINKGIAHDTKTDVMGNPVVSKPDLGALESNIQ
ncbi:right-handed parallel beta-helix repeat-containing protein [Fulvivirgaceae bacterium BMA12]|uniref:Right-handed parallel beta-helix repeat-containing protein n=1 Tax=Agaribacillus aureus TaxID=3051825 RepID=A0ABT8L8V2_9BACT|nr:right-handed parallel beta-helix repeat-containing protein [Fulvivirgaceae bacterium BMA12]